MCDLVSAQVVHVCNMHLSFVLSVLGACLRDEAHLDTGLHTQSRAARSRVRMEVQYQEGHAADDLSETTTFEHFWVC